MVGVAPAVGGVTVESAHAAGASAGNFLCPELVNGVTGSLDDRVEFGGLVRRLRGLSAAGVKGLGGRQRRRWLCSACSSGLCTETVRLPLGRLPVI